MIIELKKNPIIAMDYDGTVVTAVDPPAIGKDIGAKPWLRTWVQHGARLILWTVRSGDGQAAAVKWYKDAKIPLWGIQKNPEQSAWSQSPKAHAHLFVDDKAFGVPLIKPKSGKPYVDWSVVGPAVLASLQKSIHQR